MSAEDRLNEKSKRRRGLRRQTEESALETVDEVEEEVGDDEDESESSRQSLTAGKGRPTPSRRTQETENVKEEGNIVTRTVRSLGDYIQGVRSEVQKVIWPTRTETRRLTTIVIVVTIISALVLGFLSAIFNAIVVAGLNNPVLIFGVLFVVVIGAFAYYLRSANRRTSSF